MAITPGQKEVLKAMNAIGKPIDDTGLSVYVHHIADADMSSSGVRSRRAELSRKGLIKVSGSKRTKSGRSAAIHALTSKGKRKAVSVG